jgi:uncharacterized membrane protein
MAIAITLLILEISVPHPEDGQSFADALKHEWPSFFGFALSFFTIGIMWMNHHELFRDIERVDPGLLVLNLVLLLCISFVPFSTAVLAENLNNPDHRAPATVLYSGTFTVTAIVFNVLWWYVAYQRRLIDRHVSETRIRSRTFRYLTAPIIYGVAMPFAALITPWLALGLCVALALLFLLPLRDDSPLS